MPPIKAKEVVKDIPEVVFDCFNHFIRQKLSAGIQATFRQEDVVKMLEEKGLKRQDIFDQCLLDVEGHYEKAGWEVKYHKPAGDDTFDAYFVFSVKVRKSKR